LVETTGRDVDIERAAVRAAQAHVNALDAVRARLRKTQRHEAEMQDLRRLEDRHTGEGVFDAN
jgi:hypothetical protein